MFYIFDSIKGKNRKVNKDVLVLSVNAGHFILFALFDGVSSKINGKIGASISANYIKRFSNRYCVDEHILLDKLLLDLNTNIIESRYTEAYTTCTLVAVNRNNKSNILISHIGDSRVYIISNKYISCLTQDHKRVNTNILEKYLGLVDLKIEDINSANQVLSENDKVLICSDGFYVLMENELSEFYAAFQYKKLSTTKNHLNKLVYNKNNDDASYILVDVANV